MCCPATIMSKMLNSLTNKIPLPSHPKPILSTAPRRSGWVLVLGLGFCVPLFAWWGANIKIHPVAQMKVDAHGKVELPSNLRWTLPMAEAVDVKVGSDSWQPISERFTNANSEQLTNANPDQKIWLRWPPQSLWSLSGLELIP